MTRTFPGQTWESVTPAKAGFDEEALSATQGTLEAHGVDDDPRHLDEFDHPNPYRVVVVRNGRIAAEWNQGVDVDRHVPLRSAGKSIISSILAVAVDEGMISSPDARLAKYFPPALDVLPGEGPKENRHARHKDREITLRQLVANTSGYLKPGENPGEVKHYQTFGMNVLAHAIASRYGMYDVEDPEGSPGFETLTDSRLRVPLQASWNYYLGNFELHEDAKLSHFGYNPGVSATARDMARLGWLWCNYGRWDGEQLVPEAWLRDATTPAPAEREADPGDNMLETYGYGFWTNHEGALWPSLPTESFAALGAGGIVIWACPPLNLVVVQGPGPFHRKEINDGLVPGIVGAL
jgi:CubicO group peptidase (beta-lactamase class C family)